MAHTTEATISRYLGDAKRMPRIDLVISIAEALNVSTDYLLGLTSIPTRQSLSGEIEELICCYSNANESDKRLYGPYWKNTSRQTLKSAASGQDKWNPKDSASRQDAVKKFEDK